MLSCIHWASSELPSAAFIMIHISEAGHIASMVFGRRPRDLFALYKEVWLAKHIRI